MWAVGHERYGYSLHSRSSGSIRNEKEEMHVEKSTVETTGLEPKTTSIEVQVSNF